MNTCFLIQMKESQVVILKSENPVPKNQKLLGKYKFYDNEHPSQ